jgi:LPPG:FO 2-phospho-L-lactate transferase
VPGVRIHAAPLWMKDEAHTAQMVADALELAR